MKKIVVFYSRTGTTRKAGLEIAKQLGCDSEELLDTKERKGMTGYFRSGRDAMKKRLTKLRPMQNDVSRYDLVIIGTPIWAWNVSAPVRTFIEQKGKKLKKTAFFCTMGGSGADRAFKEMDNMLGKKPLATLALTTKEVQQDSHKKKVQEFTQALKSSRTSKSK